MSLVYDSHLLVNPEMQLKSALHLHKSSKTDGVKIALSVRSMLLIKNTLYLTFAVVNKKHLLYLLKISHICEGIPFCSFSASYP